MEPTGPNAEQIAYWNEQAGPRWVEESASLDAMLEPLGLEAMDRAAIPPGATVRDVGCGAGHTTLELARRAGPEGSVTGLDISGPMLALARERARSAGLEHARFEQADAQVAPLAGFDIAFSRFGVMFFADPVAAFANVRGGLRAGGRLVFICWQPVAENPWVLEPMRALARHVELPPPAPNAPGPFSLGDPARLRDVLERAGFADPKLEPFACPLRLGGGGSLEQVLAFVLKVGPAAALLRERPEVVPAATRSIRASLEHHLGPKGVLMDSASWIVSASA